MKYLLLDEIKIIGFAEDEPENIPVGVVFFSEENLPAEDYIRYLESIRDR